MKVLVILNMLLSVFTLSYCKQTGSTGTSPNDEEASSQPQIKVSTLYSDFKNPWGMTWLPDGRLLVTERAGEVLVFKDDKFTGQKLTGLPPIYAKGQGGLLDIQTHPNYKENGWLYFTYSKAEGDGAVTAVFRARIDGNELVDKQEIFNAGPPLKANHHFGSRLLFDKDNYLFVSVGERGTMEKVQDLNNDHGKIHRLLDDGRVPEDNPFFGKAGAEKSIWTYGHRNPQGLAYDSLNNRIWEVEHGPKGGDELNLIQKGKNYGWPLVTYGINYNGTEISDKTTMPGVEDPVKYWVPSPAPCGMAIVTSDRYKSWKGNLLIANLSHRYLGRVVLDGTTFKSEHKLLDDFARIRHVAESPDGYIYVITEGPGKLVKLLPQ